MTDRITLPNVTDDEQRTLNLLLDQLNAKAPRNLLRASYYDCNRAIRQVYGGVIPPRYYSLGIILGWSAKAVDALARRSTLERFVWPDGNLDNVGGSEVWDANFLRTEVNSAVISSLIHGPSFLINTAGDEEAGEPRSLIHVKDAGNATGEWNHRRRALDNLLSITGRKDDKVTALALYLDGLTIIAERDEAGGWQVDRQTHPWGVPAEPLVYKPRTGRPFGQSRLTRPVMGLQDQATRALVRLEGHMDVYAYPEFWMLGADESIFKNADGTMKSAFQVMLGRIKGIPDDDDAANPRADVRQFNAADPTPSLSGLNAFAKMFARETGLPDSALAITDVSNPTSAESYDASQYELIAEAEGATDDWTTPLRRTFIRALAIQNNAAEVPDKWRSIDAKWRDPRYLSRAAQADAGSKQVAAVPGLAQTEVGLELMGLSEQQIKRAMADLRRQRGGAILQTLQAAADRQGAVSVPGGDATP